MRCIHKHLMTVMSLSIIVLIMFSLCSLQAEAKKKADSGVSDNSASNNAISNNSISDNTTSDNDIDKEPEYLKPGYAIYVNRLTNTVNVYTVDEKGNEEPYKVMLCSTGRKGHRTPLGTYMTSEYYPWRRMIDDSFAQYAIRFNDLIMFHSVPYKQMKGDTLKWYYYNLLGQRASLGCVRLAVEDVKWIYDNCGVGTKVVVYEDEDPGPLGKPELKKINVTDAYRSWDPTDPDENNPWNK